MHFQLTRVGAVLSDRATRFTRTRKFLATLRTSARRGGGSMLSLMTFAIAATSVAGQTAALPVPLTILQNSGGTAPGYLFYTQQKGTAAGNGPVICDEQGRPVWYSPLTSGVAADFRVQSYQGRPVLTWATAASFQNPFSTAGLQYICDSSYNVIATVKAGNGLGADPHEFQLTAEGTALIVCYNLIKADTSSFGGVPDAYVMEGVLQEVDVATGNVLFEWHSMDQIGFDESYATAPTNPLTPYDYFHINAAKIATDGNFIVGARNTWGIYKIDRHTGRILWRLGGKKSDFALGAGLPFAWQHDPIDLDGSTIQLFDNGSGSGSRALWVTMDAANKTAAVTRSILHPQLVYAFAEGSTQSLANGNTLVSYGVADRFSEYDPAGNLIYDAKLPAGYSDYRIYRFPWVGQPATSPTVSASTLEDGTIEIHAVWNGATQVASWNILGAVDPGSAPTRITSTPWNGLDTSVTVADTLAVVQVEAVAADGTVLGTSVPLNGPFPGEPPTITAQPSRFTVSLGGTVALAVSATNATTYQWYHAGLPVQDTTSGAVTFNGATTPRLLIQGVSPTEAGAYTCVVSNSTDSVTSAAANLTVNTTAEPGHLVNVSCRAHVSDGEDALIAGFVVRGANTGTVPFAVHAMGSSLAGFGVPDALNDLELDLYALASATPLASVHTSPSGVNTGSRISGFASAPAADPIISQLLTPAAYTANVTPQGGASGVALVQVDDSSTTAYDQRRPALINVSGRAHVGQGADVLIAGFVIGGSTARTVLIRASGPTLSSFGITDALSDPQLDLYTLGGTKLASNGNWQGNSQIAAVAGSVGAFAWPDASSQDAALLVTLAPGAYTAQVSGARGDDGVALLEVYDVR